MTHDDRLQQPSTRRTTDAAHLAIVAWSIGGVALAVGAAWASDWRLAVLGLAVVGVGFAGTVLRRTLVRIEQRLLRNDQGFAGIRTRLDRIELELRQCVHAEDSASQSPSGETAMMDLAAMGSQSLDTLTAATLDRDTFPRLLRTMDKHPPAQAGPSQRAATEQTSRESASGESVQQARRVALNDQSAGIATRNLMRTWRVALRDRDLPTCRAVLGALVDTQSSALIETLKTELKQLCDSTEKQLRADFADCVRRSDFAKAIVVAASIRTLLPDRPVAEECVRIEPLLLSRLRRQHNRAAPTGPVAPSR